ncbi:pseudouridine synthase [Nitrospirillum iridis]|uniref:Pseudouridine synthase n=1 Tax=Nitrospirillum iridis TaxID=765888 RepID=A0A7X0AT14_9PROT|nr:23S rRNA pseudouridine2605 synthase [Nitrospirillum iridis]
MSDTKSPEKSGERIAKRLARAGLCSRRDAERWIADGRVAVNGQVLTSPGVNVQPGDRIVVDGQVLPEQEPTRVWRYHKPAGLVTSARDELARATVFDRLPEGMPRVISIGRLDLNTEGLLLLTNDGELARHLELPSTAWPRRYRVRVHGTPDTAKLAKLAEGIFVDGIEYGPIEAVLDREKGSNAWLTMTLREGKNREIRKVLEHLGLTVNRLIRVSYGPFQLGKLERGEVEEVPRRVLRDQLPQFFPKENTQDRKEARARNAEKAAEMPALRFDKAPKAKPPAARAAAEKAPAKATPRPRREETTEAPRAARVATRTSTVRSSVAHPSATRPSAQADATVRAKRPPQAPGNKPTGDSAADKARALALALDRALDGTPDDDADGAPSRRPRKGAVKPAAKTAPSLGERVESRGPQKRDGAKREGAQRDAPTRDAPKREDGKRPSARREDAKAAPARKAAPTEKAPRAGKTAPGGKPTRTAPKATGKGGPRKGAPSQGVPSKGGRG